MRRALIAFAAVLAVLVVGVGISVIAAVLKPIPDTSGDVSLVGLDGKVTIQRNRYGIPDITANTAEDLFFAEGYVHAQDRYHEMDVRRHVAHGSFAAVIGRRGRDVDHLVQALGLPTRARRDQRGLAAPARLALDAYARGVNAYAVGKPGSSLSFEYSAKSLVGRDYRPNPWTPLDSVAWADLLDWGFAAPMVDDIDRILIGRHMPSSRVDDLYPGSTNPQSAAPKSAADFQDPSVVAPLLRLRAAVTTVPRVTGLPNAAGTGAWVRTPRNGGPVITASVASSVSLPGPWYQVGLHCRRVTPACPYDVSGLSLSGLPGVVVGHNRVAAWAWGAALTPTARLVVVDRKKAEGRPILTALRRRHVLVLDADRERRPNVSGILALDRAGTSSQFQDASELLHVPYGLVYANLRGDRGRIPDDPVPAMPTERNAVADLLVPSLLPLTLDSRFATEGQATLRSWNRRMTGDSPGAAYFAAAWRNVLALTFHDELPRAQWPDGGPRWRVVIRQLLARPTSTWWDNLATPAVVEHRDDILREAMVAARDELTRLRSRDVDGWDWTSLHAVPLRNPTLDGWLFERGPVRVAGSGATAEATSWDAAQGFGTTVAPAARLIMRPSRPDASRWVVLTGVSGHAFSRHYTDQVDSWAAQRTLPWAFSRRAVDRATTEVLTLTSPVKE